jgi:hypothetical protein
MVDSARRAVDAAHAMETKDLQEYLKPVSSCCSRENLRLLSDVCLYLGFVSIIASIVTWFTASRENRAYGERFGIFIGLWVPSFFILSNRLSRIADETPAAAPDEE